MHKNKLRVGVVGVGALGRLHAKFYRLNQDAELVGVHDMNSEAAEKASTEFSCKKFEDPIALASECDALSVAVPAFAHFETAMPLLKMGKHVLIEKPITTEVPHARQLVASAKKKNLVLGVGHVERYNPLTDSIGLLSTPPLFIEVQRLAPFPPPRPGLYPRGTEVGIVLDLMIHDLDIILAILKDKASSVDAVGMPVLCNDEDIANARIRFSKGTVLNITASRMSQEYSRKIRIFHRDSYLTLDFAKKSGIEYSIKDGAISSRPLCVTDRNALQDEIDDFVRSSLLTIESGVLQKMKVTGEDGLATLELAARIISGIRKNHMKNPLYSVGKDAYADFCEVRKIKKESE